ncbi:hypothetical protein GN244_ATG08377 [Phytophthora infestans]|uniref:HTH psq-type domain-containing protein n=1 Tax=Phytophthora infestans TaxID=4787 RepID=A0A833W2B1_PHYIN|nr:hypothetical protein GN244_ATG08377 [Phytophthora infestans]
MLTILGRLDAGDNPMTIATRFGLNTARFVINITHNRDRILSYVTSALEEELLRATVCLSETTAKPRQPRRDISVRKKIDIVEMLDKGATTTEITTGFTVHKTVVGRIKRDRARILAYSSSGGDLTATRIPPTTRAKVIKKIRNVSLKNKLAILDRL